MKSILFISFLFVLWAFSFFLCFYRALGWEERPRSRPLYYGLTGLMISLISSLGGGAIGFLGAPSTAWGLAWFASAVGGVCAWYQMHPSFPAQKAVEKGVSVLLAGSAFVAIGITLALVGALFFETVHFFSFVPLGEFLGGLHWNPQTTYGEQEKGGDYGLYGALPLFTGTLLIMGIALAIALPLGLFIAIYLQEYARKRTRALLKPTIEILAGIPTIVYGFFALVVVMPFLQTLGECLKLDVSPQSALGVGIVMGMMIIPYISSLSDDALGAVPQVLRDHSLALGATSAETIKYVVIPAAFPGILSASLLAISRAIGETMLVVMAAGLTAHLTFNPLQSVTTVTVQIVSLLTGDQEFDSPKTLSAFALGMALFLMTLGLNIISLRMARRYRKKYEL